MKTSLTGAPIHTKNPGFPAMSVEEISDEDITEKSKASKINEARNDMEIDPEEKQKKE